MHDLMNKCLGHALQLFNIRASISRQITSNELIWIKPVLFVYTFHVELFTNVI